MDELFDDAAPAAPDGAAVVGVAVNANVWSTYDYAWPAGWQQARVGLRVRVPFGRGNRPTIGFVVRAGTRQTDRKLKLVAEQIDAEPQLDASQMALAEWIASYYLTPLGLVLPAMVPSAVGRHAARTETVVTLACPPADWPGGLGPRQRRFLDELFEARKQGIEPVPLEQLLRHSGARRDTVGRLLGRKLIVTASRPVVLGDLQDTIEADPFELNDDQRRAVAAIVAKLGKGFSPILLYGVTGSGKTEVYIRAIRNAVDAGGQAILLTPEIALATQTLQRLLRRLPRVLVLHSGLTDAQRAFAYQQIHDGHAAVVVGPRSAIFAPTRKLALIVVDEEHEGSYKQDGAPRYHARDVAVKRAQLVGVPVLLGSATPSLESHLNVLLGRYERLRLPHREKGLPLPTLKLVHLRKDLRPGRIELIGRTMTAAMAATLDRDEQIILLMNRRGYASYVFCPSCKWEMTCEDCTRTMVFHQSTRLVMCHYCQRTEALPEQCPACRGKLVLFGFGIQRIEGELARKFPDARVARMDSDTMTSPKQFQKVFDDFRDGELDLLLGTQMVAKGLDFPRVSLVGVVSADTSLSIPDFRASERTFQLIVQVAGRAGRAGVAGQVVVQTLHADEPAIRHAARHDYAGFSELEMSQRREALLPPVSRMVRFVVRHQDVNKAQAGANKLAKLLRQVLPREKVTMWGPQPAGVFKIRDQFRFEILTLCVEPALIQRMVRPHMPTVCRAVAAEIVADADPMNLL